MSVMVGGRIAKREPVQDDVEPLTWAIWERACKQDTITFLAVEGRLEALARRIVAALAPYDLVVTPALAKRPLAIGECHGRGPDPWGNYQRSGYFTPFTAVVNVSGLPAISLPLYQGDDGLPTAVQMIGPPAREDVLLQVATELEEALPWVDRRPSIAETVR